MSRILIAEDHAVNRELMREILEGLGHEVVEATNGEEAVAAAAGCAPDLVILDIQMPKMDGITALRHLRALPAGEALRVMALTAYAMPEERARIAEAGFDGHITKPFALAVLKAEIARQLALGKARAAG